MKAEDQVMTSALSRALDIGDNHLIDHATGVVLVGLGYGCRNGSLRAIQGEGLSLCDFGALRRHLSKAAFLRLPLIDLQRVDHGRRQALGPLRIADITQNAFNDGAIFAAIAFAALVISSIWDGPA